MLDFFDSRPGVDNRHCQFSRTPLTPEQVLRVLSGTFRRLDLVVALDAERRAIVLSERQRRIARHADDVMNVQLASFCHVCRLAGELVQTEQVAAHRVPSTEPRTELLPAYRSPQPIGVGPHLWPWSVQSGTTLALLACQRY